MSYIKLDIDDADKAREQVRKVFTKQNEGIAEAVDKIEIGRAEARFSRRLFAVDSGFNSAYETPFVVFKAAVVDQELNVDRNSSVYLFHAENNKTDRLRRLLCQQIMYEALLKTIETGAADGSILLVDGTLALTVFYPTLKDGKEYKDHFRSFYEMLYSPLVDLCLKRDALLVGFLKRTGSTYLARHLGISGTYDSYIMNAALVDHGTYISSIPIVDMQAKSIGICQDYVTLYLNLKRWNYRFELLKQQENHLLEAVENLLYWATETHHGMNPVFSKADENARVSKREANLKFNYLIQVLSEKDRNRLRWMARKKTHFGFPDKNLVAGARKPAWESNR